MKIKFLDKLFWFANNYYNKSYSGNQEYRSIFVIVAYFGLWFLLIYLFINTFIYQIPDFTNIFKWLIPFTISIVLSFIYYFYINHYNKIIEYYDKNRNEINSKNYKILFVFTYLLIGAIAGTLGTYKPE